MPAEALTAAAWTTEPYVRQTQVPAPKSELGQADFLKVLTTMLRSQDPLEPMKDTDFMAQMAQFTALDQARGMSQDIARLRAEQQFSYANTLIGKTVTYKPVAEDEPATGIVTGVSLEAGTPYIEINGQSYELAALHTLALAEK